MFRRTSLMIVFALLITLLLPSVSVAQTPGVSLAVEPFFDGMYRSGSWLPFRVTVANDGPDVNAVVSLQLGATYETVVDLPRGANKSLVMYAQAPGVFRRSATARVLIDGAEAQKQEVPLSGVAATDQIIGVLAAQPITMPLPGVTQQMRQVRSLPLAVADLPERPEGLSMFDVLLIDGIALTDLDDSRRQAIDDWVHTGGQLVIGGAALDETLAALPETLRVAAASGPAPAGSNSLFPELNDSPPPSLALTTTQETRVIATQDSAPVGVQQAAGRGSVSILGWSLSADELRAADTEKATWRQIVRLRSSDPNMGFAPPPDAQGQQIGWALMQLPVLAVPPLGTLIALLGVYILIVGPGLYLLLRRLDRQVWGWVAIPLVTLLFTLGAYGYGLRIRGNDVILNQISLVEPSEGRARVRTYAGIFSPRDDSYTVRTSSDALFRPMPAEWGQGTAAGRFLQDDGGVEDLRVPQWSMSTFAAEQIIEGSPLESNLTLSGTLLRGSIRNAGDTLIRDLALFQNTRVLKVGDLAPGQTRTVELDLAKDSSSPWAHSMAMLLLRDRWDFNQPTQPPADIRMQMMVLDAIFSSPFDRPTEPHLLGWIDQSPIPLEIEQRRLQRQQLTLLYAPANVAFDQSGPIALPAGWLKPAMEATGQGGPCMNQFGSGWYLDSGVITTTLQLPPAVQQRRIEAATATIRSDGPQLSELVVSAYDWSANDWVQQRTGLGTHDLDQPARYVSPAGQIMLRAELPGPGGKGGGCINIDLSVTGAQL